MIDGTVWLIQNFNVFSATNPPLHFNSCCWWVITVFNLYFIFILYICHHCHNWQDCHNVYHCHLCPQPVQERWRPQALCFWQASPPSCLSLIQSSGKLGNSFLPSTTIAMICLRDWWKLIMMIHQRNPPRESQAWTPQVQSQVRASKLIGESKCRV